MSLTPSEIEEIEAVAIDLQSWGPGVPRHAAEQCVARLRALLPQPETLAEAVMAVLDRDDLFRMDGKLFDRLSAALERERGKK